MIETFLDPETKLKINLSNSLIHPDLLELYHAC